MRTYINALLGLSLLAVACGGGDGSPQPGPGQDGQFDDGVAPPGKADTQGFEDRGYEATCILRLANAADENTLVEDAGVWSVSAREILEARAGADGRDGTGDDVAFETLEQLDDVDWVGYFAFQDMFDHARDAGYCPGLGEEYEHAGEAEATDLIIRRIGERMQRRYADGHRPSTRGLHAKGRCLQADFTVDASGLPPELRVGVFAEDTTYPAWVRFSNGDPHVQADSEGDVRAMAIKLMNVPGEKLLDDERDASTQDFLLNHTPAVATADVIHFADVIDLAEDDRNPALAFLAWNPFDIELDSILLAIEAITKGIVNPLSTQYWSQTPYRLGPDTSAVKYSARPCDGEQPAQSWTTRTPTTSRPPWSSNSRPAMSASSSPCSDRPILNGCRSRTHRSSGVHRNPRSFPSPVSCFLPRISHRTSKQRPVSTCPSRHGMRSRSTSRWVA